MFLFFPAVTVVAALYVMRPRRGWLFDLDADSMRTDMLAREQSQRFSSAEKFYLAYVLKLSEMRQQNECPLRCREWALLAAFATLLITIVWTGFSVWTSSPPDT